jgi:hypothetical protein
VAIFVEKGSIDDIVSKQSHLQSISSTSFRATFSRNGQKSSSFSKNNFIIIFHANLVQSVHKSQFTDFCTPKSSIEVGGYTLARVYSCLQIVTSL